MFSDFFGHLEFGKLCITQAVDNTLRYKHGVDEIGPECSATTRDAVQGCLYVIVLYR